MMASTNGNKGEISEPSSRNNKPMKNKPNAAAVSDQKGPNNKNNGSTKIPPITASTPVSTAPAMKQKWLNLKKKIKIWE